MVTSKLTQSNAAAAERVTPTIHVEKRQSPPPQPHPPHPHPPHSRGPLPSKQTPPSRIQPQQNIHSPLHPQSHSQQQQHSHSPRSPSSYPPIHQQQQHMIGGGGAGVHDGFGVGGGVGMARGGQPPQMNDPYSSGLSQDQVSHPI